ncbi:hypothetical protein D5086_014702 [Populus alba]|uniref:Uncharacterized protein n=1 Tax=Populus alba TaxID=43335 RepID=A0ACC4C023_POPAL
MGISIGCLLHDSLMLFTNCQGQVVSWFSQQLTSLIFLKTRNAVEPLSYQGSRPKHGNHGAAGFLYRKGSAHLWEPATTLTVAVADGPHLSSLGVRYCQIEDSVHGSASASCCKCAYNLRPGSIAMNCMAPTPTTLFGFDYQLVTFPGQESSRTLQIIISSFMGILLISLIEETPFVRKINHASTMLSTLMSNSINRYHYIKVRSFHVYQTTVTISRNQSCEYDLNRPNTSSFHHSKELDHF